MKPGGEFHIQCLSLFVSTPTGLQLEVLLEVEINDNVESLALVFL